MERSVSIIHLPRGRSGDCNERTYRRPGELYCILLCLINILPTSPVPSSAQGLNTQGAEIEILPGFLSLIQGKITFCDETATPKEFTRGSTLIKTALPVSQWRRCALRAMTLDFPPFRNRGTYWVLASSLAAGVVVNRLLQLY